MKVFLINPPIKNIIGLEVPLLVRQNEGFFPPLGLMYLASYLKRNLECELKLSDMIAEGIGYEEIEKQIRNFQPDVVGITAHTHNLIDVILLVDTVKKIDKRIHVCLGGPHANIFPREAAGINGVDSVVLGDGETTFMELVRCLDKKAGLEKVKGLSFKQDGEYVNTGLREGVKDLDSLPFPDRRLLDYKRYYSILGKKAVMTTMVSSRGCPYQCAFCSTPKGFYRVRSAENIVDEVEECMQLGIGEVHFVDDVFNAVPERVMRICDEIKRRGLKIKWSFRGRIDRITRPLLISSKEAGCYRIHLGVETSEDEGLKRLKKGITVGQVRQVFTWTRDAGIDTVAYFLIGCPHEKTRQDVLRTIDFSKDIDPDFALFNILTPYPSTELYEEWLKEEGGRDNYWREFALNPSKDFQPHPWQGQLSREELFGLLNLAYRKFYLRPRFLLRMLTLRQGPGFLIRRFKTGASIFRLQSK